MRVRTLGISIACHAAIGLVLVSLATHERARVSKSTSIELIDAPPAPPAPPSPATIEASLGGGSHAGSIERAAPRIVTRPARIQAARGEIEIDDGDPRGEVRIEQAGGAMGEDAGAVGDGEGRGRGSGDGKGIGLGDGARVVDERITLETPPAPPASKAREAKLVYPVREREVDDAELFIARVTIDREGFVVGARLVRGFGGPRDAQAADLIWKFRYAPALDDQGRPIPSTFDQRFLVGR